MNYKAVVVISGACMETVYAKRIKTLVRSAARKLSYFEPGVGNLWPQYLEVFQSLGKISGNRSRWKSLFRIPYAKLRKDWHEHVIRRSEKLRT